MIRICCFGGISVQGLDERPIHFRSRKHVALLAFLAANPSRVHGRDTLVRLLWDSPLSSARHSLSQALYDLKRRLGEFSTERFGDGLRLVSPVEFEGLKFERAVERDDLTRAVELYRGDFAAAYDGVGTESFENWVDDERRRYRILAQAVLHRYVARCDARGDWGQMCVAALKLVGIDPLSEQAHQALMRALWLHGDQASALRHFSEIEEQLSRDLPSGISLETRELVQRIRSSAPPAPVEVSRSDPPLVGREQEFGALRDLVGSTSRGQGGLVVLRGEAGIGKTRLCAELSRCASVEGVRLLKSRCFAAEEDIAYGPVVDALRGLSGFVSSPRTPKEPRYPHVARLLSSDVAEERTMDFEADLAGERRRLCEEVASLISRLCESATTVWIVDDIHWIDASSASLLSYVVRRLADRRFLLLVTVRDNTDLSEPCQKLLRERSTDQESRTIALGPLPLNAVRSLLERLDDNADEEVTRKIHRLSGGNPFLALELLHDGGVMTRSEVEQLTGEVLQSERVRSLLRARLQGLAPRSIRLLEAIAVLGRNATPAHAANAAGLKIEEASDVSEELYARGVLRDDADRLEFAHDITREFIYRNLGGVRRASLHLFVAEALARDLEGTLPTIARHFHLGGDRARAFEYAIRAATSSMASFGHEEARAMASLALSHAATDRERFESLEILGCSALAIGHLEEAEQHLQQQLTLGECLAAAEKVRASLLLGLVRLENSDWEGASKALRGAEISRLAGPAERLEAGLSSLSLQLRAAMRQLDGRLASQICDQIKMAQLQGARDGVLTNAAAARSYYSRGAYAAFFRSAIEADELVELACKSASEESNELSIRILLLHGVVKSHRALWDQATLLFRQALQRATEERNVVEKGRAWNNLAYCALEQADWADADNFSRASLDVYGHLPAGSPVARTPLTNLGDTFFFQGLARKAIPIYEEALRDGRPDLRPQVLASLGLAHLQLGNRAEASACWNTLRALNADGLLGVQEQFKIAWLDAFMAKRSGPCASEELQRAAHAQQELNVGSYLKLIWLASLFGGNRQEETAAEAAIENLRDVRLGWFARFSARWYRLANSGRSRS
jgi:DNA-binding SARP family transcriptional activator